MRIVRIILIFHNSLLLNYLLTVSCSHARAFKYFEEAVANPGTFIGRKCSTLIQYDLNFCANNKKVDMGGSFSEMDRGSFYLTTNAEEPFGKGY